VGTKYFKHGSFLNNIVVMPYLDKNYWSLYIMEKGCTIHCDFIPGFHNNRLSKEFGQNVRIAWALSRGLNEDDADFKTFVNVDTILPKVWFHNNRLSKEFAQNVRIAWALSRGLNEYDADFKTFVNVDTILPKVFVQKNSWECGH
jgi:succinate dehydrogenase flavin-adding protein (antitoxin of CptAB toxin-antitoxin module)